MNDSLDKSITASNTHIFLGWHDINFIVPKKLTFAERRAAAKTERADIVEQHIEEMGNA